MRNLINKPKVFQGPKIKIVACNKTNQKDNSTGLSKPSRSDVTRKNIQDSIIIPSYTPEVWKKKEKKKRQQGNTPRNSLKDRMTMRKKRRREKERGTIISNLVKAEGNIDLTRMMKLSINQLRKLAEELR